MYFTDRGIEELEERRGDEQVAVAWLAERLRDFVNLNPDFDVAVDRLATWLARLDDDEDLYPLTRTVPDPAPTTVIPDTCGDASAPAKGVFHDREGWYPEKWLRRTYLVMVMTAG